MQILQKVSENEQKSGKCLSMQEKFCVSLLCFFFMRNWGMRKVFEKLRFLRFYQGLQKKKLIFCGFSFRFKMCITAFWSEKSQIRRTIRRSMHTKKKMLYREQESKNNCFQNRLFFFFAFLERHAVFPLIFLTPSVSRDFPPGGFKLFMGRFYQ